MANQRSRSACDRRSTVPRRALRPDVIPFVLVLAASCVAPRPTNAPPAAASEAAVVRNSEVRAIASRPDTAVASDSVARVVPIEGGYNVGVAVVRRQRVGDKTPPDALSHHDITEVYHIIHGAGVFVSGGVIIGVGRCLRTAGAYGGLWGRASEEWGSRAAWRSRSGPATSSWFRRTRRTGSHDLSRRRSSTPLFGSIHNADSRSLPRPADTRAPRSADTKPNEFSGSPAGG